MLKLNDIDLSSLESALKSLEEATSTPPKNDLERDGVIQRFEYTFELCWKSIRKFLFALGRSDVSGSPKPILRDALEERLISELEKWFDFLEARNLTTHIYNESQAVKVYNVAKQFPAYVKRLLSNLKEKQKQK